ncbi:MAG: hypothetical protein JNL70_12170 [Saprospiraceae bacterium]|nr:hypothetical protein [Saprospiraceae bacterium]
MIKNTLENIYFDTIHFVTKQKAWLIAILIAIYALVTDKKDVLTNSAGVIEAVTLFAVFFTALNMLRKQRYDELDQKLTVVFLYNNKIILKCENAYLAGQSDIRQWGQSIGQLMNSGERLDFEPYIREESSIVTIHNKQYRHYIVTFTLHSLNKVAEKHKALYQKGQYELWICALDGTSKEEKIGEHEP